jgi:hypothetical protein
MELSTKGGKFCGRYGPKLKRTAFELPRASRIDRTTRCTGQRTKGKGESNHEPEGSCISLAPLRRAPFGHGRCNPVIAVWPDQQTPTGPPHRQRQSSPELARPFPGADSSRSRRITASERPATARASCRSAATVASAENRKHDLWRSVRADHGERHRPATRPAIEIRAPTRAAKSRTSGPSTT